MPFLRASTDISVFTIASPDRVTSQKLRQHAFRPIDDLKTETLAAGWTSIEDMADTAFQSSPEYGEWLCFALRVDRRSIPGAVLKRHFEDALKEERGNMARAGADVPIVSRARKKELKEQLMLRLLPHVEPVPSLVDVAMNMHTGLTFVSTASKGLLQLFQDTAAASFGVTPEPLPLPEDPQTPLRAIFDGEVHTDFNGHAYAFSQGGQVTLSGISSEDEAVTIVAKNDLSSAQAGLEAGFSIDKLRIRMERDGEAFAWQFSLTPELTLLAVRTPKTEESVGEAALLEKLYLFEQCVGAVRTLFCV